MGASVPTRRRAAELHDTDGEVAASSSAVTVQCPSHNVVRRSSNSWLILWPRIVDVYLGQYWYGAAQRQQTDSFWSATANDQTFWARMVEYGINGGSYGGSLVIPTPVVDNPAGPIEMSVADIDHVVHAMVDAGQFPRTDNNDFSSSICRPMSTSQRAAHTTRTTSTRTASRSGTRS